MAGLPFPPEEVQNVDGRLVVGGVADGDGGGRAGRVEKELTEEERRKPAVVPAVGDYFNGSPMQLLLLWLLLFYHAAEYIRHGVF